jgi:hypothetical protein
MSGNTIRFHTPYRTPSAPYPKHYLPLTEYKCGCGKRFFSVEAYLIHVRTCRYARSESWKRFGSGSGRPCRGCFGTGMRQITFKDFGSEEAYFPSFGICPECHGTGRQFDLS